VPKLRAELCNELLSLYLHSILTTKVVKKREIPKECNSNISDSFCEMFGKTIKNEYFRSVKAKKREIWQNLTGIAQSTRTMS
jgi:hypothetical protein